MFDFKRILLVVIVTGLAPWVQAAELTNPMRPPVANRSLRPVNHDPVRSAIDWELQSVLIGEDRAVAVIDGVSVTPGESYQGARLIQITAERVVLKGAEGKRIVLKLTPDIKQKNVSEVTEISLK